MGPSRSTIGVAFVLDALAALRALGLDTRRITRGARVEEKTLMEDGGRLPVETFGRILDMAEELSGDPSIGLHTGERARARSLIAHLVLSCPDIEDGLRHACRFGGWFVDTMAIELEDVGDTLAVKVRSESIGGKGSHHVIEYVLLMNARHLAAASGNSLALARVHFGHGDSGRRGEIERIFGCKAAFDQPATALMLPRAAMKQRARFANPLVADQIEKFVAAFSQPAPEAFRDHLATVMRTIFGHGCRVDRPSVCRRLGISDSMLTRKLEEAGLTFADVREAVLLEAAQALLLNSSLRAESVSQCFGFGDASSFTRVFKRRTGQTPTQYRQQTFGGLLQ